MKREKSNKRRRSRKKNVVLQQLIWLLIITRFLISLNISFNFPVGKVIPLVQNSLIIFNYIQLYQLKSLLSFTLFLFYSFYFYFLYFFFIVNNDFCFSLFLFNLCLATLNGREKKFVLLVVFTRVCFY